MSTDANGKRHTALWDFLSKLLLATWAPCFALVAGHFIWTVRTLHNHDVRISSHQMQFDGAVSKAEETHAKMRAEILEAARNAAATELRTIAAQLNAIQMSFAKLEARREMEGERK